MNRPGRTAPPFSTLALPAERTVLAPDGAEVRVLAALAGGGMAHFRLAAGQVSAAVAHRTVEEIWFVVSGRGRMWRRHGEREELTDLVPGISLTIPLGTHFQFRASPDEALAVVAVTMPPWPGEGEAERAAGPWQASPAAATGYSGTPLVKKLGIQPGHRLLLLDAPTELAAWLGPLPDGVVFEHRAGPQVDIAHVFVTQRRVLARHLPKLRRTLGPAAAVWVSWPKKPAKVSTDVTEGTVRELALPLGFVDTKVCAVTDTWSALKLVVRRALR